MNEWITRLWLWWRKVGAVKVCQQCNLSQGYFESAGITQTGSQACQQQHCSDGSKGCIH